MDKELIELCRQVYEVTKWEYKPLTQGANS